VGAGAEGERRVGAGLDGLAAAGVVALHARLIPGSKANIDHLAVAPNGLWVINAKRYRGEVTRRDVSGWFSTHSAPLRRPARLHEARRYDGYQVAAVREAPETDRADVPAGETALLDQRA